MDEQISDTDLLEYIPTEAGYPYTITANNYEMVESITSSSEYSSLFFF